jgi:hypothetical protein
MVLWFSQESTLGLVLITKPQWMYLKLALSDLFLWVAGAQRMRSMLHLGVLLEGLKDCSMLARKQP